MTLNEPVALRVQRFSLRDQVLVLSQLADARAGQIGISPRDVAQLFYELRLPAPAKIGNEFAGLCKAGLLAKGRDRGEYGITPLGKRTIDELVSRIDRQSLEAEAASYGGAQLGRTLHATVPPSLAPPALIEPIRSFLDAHPFDTNVFGMTRFPSIQAGGTDALSRALKVAREVCAKHGLEFHLASDRAILDDLWANTTAHMWASRYGIGFFEDRVERGLNHNLTIEIGGMLMIGHRCALLKDGSIEKMPTDLVGMIYKSVDLAQPNTVSRALHTWIRDDLSLNECADCP